VVARIFITTAELIFCLLRSMVMKEKQDALAAPQAVDGHHVGGNTDLTHLLVDSNHGIDVFEIVLNFGMRLFNGFAYVGNGFFSTFSKANSC